MLSRPGIWLAAFVAALHFWANKDYGYARDELYFIVCGQRPDWGYVDQPPLIPLVAAFTHALFPGSLRLLRLLPAVAHAATVVLTAETARTLGGGIWAQLIAGLSALLCSIYLGLGTFLYTDVLQPASWLFCAYGLIRLIRDKDECWSIPVGIVLGLALNTKYTIAFWILALLLGLALTSARRSLLRPGVYVAAAIAVLMVLPNLIWQWENGWPFLDIALGGVEERNIIRSPWTFMLIQVRDLNPATAPIWIAGLAAFAFWDRFADLRAIAVAFGLLILAMMALHAKSYYPSGAYAVLFAGGAVLLEAWITTQRLRAVAAIALTALGLPALPFVVPVLPIERFEAYAAFLRIPPVAEEKLTLGRLPLFYADMLGWEDLAALVGQAYQSLSPEERAEAVFFGSDYGEAAAVDVMAKSWGLPASISLHHNYYLWGPHDHTGSVVINLGGRREELLKLYSSVEAMGVTNNPWALPFETGLTVWICRGRFLRFEDDWSRLKSNSLTGSFSHFQN